MQSSVDVSVWNTQWLLATLMGGNHSSSAGETLPSIQEVDEEGEDEVQVRIYYKNYEEE